MDGKDVQLVFLEGPKRFIQRQATASRATLLGSALPGMIHEHLAHGPGHRRKQVAAVCGLLQHRFVEEL